MIRMSGRHAAILIFGGLGVLIAASILAFAMVRVGGLTPEDGAGFLAVLVLMPMLAILLWAYGWTLATAEAPELLLGLARLERRWALIAVGGGFAVAGLSWTIVTATSPWLGLPFNIFEDLLLKAGGITPALVAVLLFVGVVLAPMWEEIVFRGALYGWLRRRFGIGFAATLSALLHALFHLDPAVIPALFAVFLVFALIYEWSSNLWAPILAHATNNTLSFLWVFWQLG